MKSIIGAILVTVFTVSGIQATASPSDNANLLTQPDVKLLSAKIENAIAELPETRTQETIQNAAFFILAKQDAALDVKVGAIDSVILNAQSMGDQQVVKALTLIELGQKEQTETVTLPNTAVAVSVPSEKVPFRAPPSTVSKGGSDY